MSIPGLDDNSVISARPVPVGDDEDGSGVWLGADLDVAAGAVVFLGSVAGMTLSAGVFDDDDDGKEFDSKTGSAETKGGEDWAEGESGSQDRNNRRRREEGACD
ncbi:MAG: hypothetical protein V6Z86_06795 [Hyphomicrobiales bacterium]